jgi:enoyl-CoA hydratase
VPPGEGRAAAEALAAELAKFPQACLRSDRASAYEALGHTMPDALATALDHVDLRGLGRGARGGVVR